MRRRSSTGPNAALVRKIRQQFDEACALVEAHDYVAAQYKAPRPALLLLNNSFLHRDQITETTKSDLYLCADISPGTPARLDVASVKILRTDTAHRSEK